MPVSPITPNIDVITLSIKSEGSPIKDTYQVLSVYIDRSVNNIPYCKIRILDGSAAKEDFPISDSDTFVPGNKIEVLAGYGNKNDTVFKGMVVKHGLRISAEEGSVLEVVCQDEAVKMTEGRKNAYFKEMTDSAIISKLAKNNGLTAKVTATPNQLKEVIQYGSSDWDFMVGRAEANGLITIAQDGKIIVKHPDEETTAILGLTYGKDILAFEAEIDAATQLKARKSKYANIRGTVKFQGSASAVPGTLIEIKGLGQRFNGNGFISGVVHEIKDGNWVTTATLGLSAEWFASTLAPASPLASGLLPGIQGLQVGKVKQINDDPDGEFRVLISLPLIQSSDEGIWARLSSFYASSDAGAFFYPEVEDEVVVGFLNDDPRYPVILGSMYSSSQSAPETPGKKNQLKAFVSREKMMVTFDEEKKIITIITPKKNQLVLNDEEGSIKMSDQNKNFIKLSPDGIELNSAAAIKITAAQSIAMDGPSGITATASGGTIDLRSMTISCTADIEFAASGGASTTVSSNGEVSITGTMVLINS